MEEFCVDKHFPTSWKREGHGFLARTSKQVYSEIQDTQVDVLHQDVSVHQPSGGPIRPLITSL